MIEASFSLHGIPVAVNNSFDDDYIYHVITPENLLVMNEYNSLRVQGKSNIEARLEILRRWFDREFNRWEEKWLNRT